MSERPRYPSLYQVNTRVRLTELARRLGRPATLDDLPDDELDRWAALGFDWVWLLDDQLGSETWDRDGNDLATRGLYLDVPAWQASVFCLRQATE